ncbi:hypothetical protein HK105_204848 [Polyrhizophydium stewartii]|uniref:Rho-GAP domain-containing protein n=1 Tax=Polyrhizophydium stewartii TaxID=2732419 RepID=A0ABR4N812_9FUNG
MLRSLLSTATALVRSAAPASAGALRMFSSAALRPVSHGAVARATTTAAVVARPVTEAAPVRTYKIKTALKKRCEHCYFAVRKGKLLTSATAFNALWRFRSLWIISLAYCDPLPTCMHALSSFVCLGLVDVSFTRINWKTLQQGFGRTQILRFNCFGCAFLDTLDAGGTGGKSRFNRGFLIFVLPHVWVLDGVYVCWVERQRWQRFFMAEAGGVFSELVRKWKLDDSMRVFVPSRLKSGITTFGRHFDGAPVPSEPADLWAEDASDTWDEDVAPEDEPRDDPLERAGDGMRRIWTAQAREWMRGCPATFTMAVDHDVWRLRRLARAFQDHITACIAADLAGNGGGAADPTGGRGGDADADWDEMARRCIGNSITSFVCPPFEEMSSDASAESRSLFVVILFGSLFRAVPSQLLHSTLVTLFGPRPWSEDAALGALSRPHWTARAVSVLSWPLRDRATYLGLLVGRTLMDSASPAASTAGIPLLPTELLHGVRRILSLVHRAMYPAAPASLSSLSTSSLPPRPASPVERLLQGSAGIGHARLQGFDVDAAGVPEGLLDAPAFLGLLAERDRRTIAAMLLNVVQALCLCDADHAFVAHSEMVMGLLARSTMVMHPDAAALHAQSQSPHALKPLQQLPQQQQQQLLFQQQQQQQQQQYQQQFHQQQFQQQFQLQQHQQFAQQQQQQQQFQSYHQQVQAARETPARPDHAARADHADDAGGSKLSSLAKNLRKRTAAVAKAAFDRGSELGAIAVERGSEWGSRAGLAGRRRDAGEQSAAAHTDPVAAAAAAAAPNPDFPIFGASIFDAVMRSKHSRNPFKDVPTVVFRCIEYLDAYGLDEVGIYRLSGSTSEIQNLRRLFNTGDDINLATLNPDPNAVASLFKAYFRELPDIIITRELVEPFSAPFARFSDDDCSFPPHLTADDQHKITSDPRVLASLALVVRKLPRQHYMTLALLFAHLSRVSALYAVNKMSLGNLQVVWTPTIGFSSALFATLLAQHKRLLPLDSPPPASQPLLGLNIPSPRPPTPLSGPASSPVAGGMPAQQGSSPGYSIALPPSPAPFSSSQSFMSSINVPIVVPPRKTSQQTSPRGIAGSPSQQSQSQTQSQGQGQGQIQIPNRLSRPSQNGSLSAGSDDGEGKSPIDYDPPAISPVSRIQLDLPQLPQLSRFSILAPPPVSSDQQPLQQSTLQRIFRAVSSGAPAASAAPAAPASQASQAAPATPRSPSPGRKPAPPVPAPPAARVKQRLSKSSLLSDRSDTENPFADALFAFESLQFVEEKAAPAPAGSGSGSGGGGGGAVPKSVSKSTTNSPSLALLLEADGAGLGAPPVKPPRTQRSPRPLE